MDMVGNGAAALKAIERRREARYEGQLKSSFTISDGGGVRVVPCVIDSLSASAMRVVTDDMPVLGQFIWIDIEDFGPVRASIETVRHDGFICHSLLNDAARKRLGTWVSWLARRRGRTDRDKRSFMRSRPQDGRTTVAFEDGEVVAVLLKDISRSGVAVLSEHMVLPGTRVMVGRVLGQVSRMFSGGFAVAFERVIEAAEADQLVAGYQVKALPVSHAG